MPERSSGPADERDAPPPRPRGDVPGREPGAGGGYRPGGSRGRSPGSQPPGWDRSGWQPPFRPPWIVGPAADRILGFLAGLFGNVIGLIAAVVVMFLWADNAQSAQDHAERRAHARGVSAAAGVGCLFPVLLAILGLLAFFSLSTHAGGVLTPIRMPLA